MFDDVYNKTINDATPQQKEEALQLLLRPHARPVFGASKTIEHEVAAFEALKVLGYISSNADEYDLVESLRITKSKARSLLYQVALRSKPTPDNINEALRDALTSTRIIRDSDLYLIEVHDQLTMDRLRKRIRDYGYLSDGSFSGSLAKVPEDALIKLIADLIPEDQKADIKKKLVKAGFPDKSFTGLIKASLIQAAKKLADGTGEAAAKAITENILLIVEQGWEALKPYLQQNCAD